jgi:hypothetical protein
MTPTAPTCAPPSTRRRRPGPDRRSNGPPSRTKSGVATRPAGRWKRWRAVVGAVTAVVFLGDLGQ